MNIIEVNTCLYGSTGTIMCQIANTTQEFGHKVWTASSYQRNENNNKKDSPYIIIIGGFASLYSHLLLGRLTGFQGCFSRFATRRLLNKLNEIHPDLIHLHNLHDCYINLPLLFHHIKKHQIPVVWTLHDCWAFTGQCPYFDIAKCTKWETGCHQCSQYRRYPRASIDRTKVMWKLKKKWFTGVQNMTIITPSQWLADLVKLSYLKEYPVKVINNGIDHNVFKPTPSDFIEKHKLNEKNIVLGVAFDWGKRKGLDVFIELAELLDSDRYRIVLVGIDDKSEKHLPDCILPIHRTQNQRELAEIYTAADVFVNPTLEDNFPTTNLEALACGTPVLTFNTGGSPECIDESCGSVVECHDIDAMEREIIRICETRPYLEEACLKRARGFDMNDKFTEYAFLYNKVVEGK